MKYKVGDKVKLKKEVKQWVGGRMLSFLGKTVTISKVNGCFYEFAEDKDNFAWLESSVDCLVYNKIVITTDGTETLARLYEGGKVVKSATAKCSPKDEFDFNIGARLAFDRLIGEEKASEKEEEYFKGKAVCVYVESHLKFDLTVGKIYDFSENDGCGKHNRGGKILNSPRKDIESINAIFGKTKFIPIVE